MSSEDQGVQPLTTAAPASRAIGLWRLAVRRITHILRIRRRWAAIGQLLQDPIIQDLVQGLERRQGHLVRRRPAR